jgi:hypothetical protein
MNNSYRDALTVLTAIMFALCIFAMDRCDTREMTCRKEAFDRCMDDKGSECSNVAARVCTNRGVSR